MNSDRPEVAELMADVSAALAPRAAGLCADVCEVILREISLLRGDKPVVSLLAGERIDESAAEATLGYRLRQHHVGLVCWVGDATSARDEITRLERAASRVAEQAACKGQPMFLPRDECCAWAWLPFGMRGTLDAENVASSTADADEDIRFAFGNPAHGAAGFLRTHQEAAAALAVAFAADPATPQVTTFSEVAPVALMLGSRGLLQAWVSDTLGQLAVDDEQQARLRQTLRVFLADGSSYKAAAEHLILRKNTVQYRIRKAEEALGRPLGENRLNVELALLAAHWLGSAVLQPAVTSAVPD